MTTDQQARSQVRELFARNLEYVSKGQIREWVDLFHPDGVLEFPFPPPGVPSRFQGHHELYEHMKDFPELFEVSFSDLRFHDTVDPDLVIAEFVGTGRGRRTKRPFNQVYISVVRFSDGRIVSFRDFWNPLATIRAVLSVGQIWRSTVHMVRERRRSGGARGSA